MEQSTSPRRRKLSAILMVDVSGFSRMMESDEQSAIALIQDFHQRVRELVEGHDGRVVDTAGDSVFGEFDSVIQAIYCARAIQQGQAEANRLREPEARYAARIGVHLGDVVVEDTRLYGDGVNIAARLEALADPGAICLSAAVYHQVHRQVDFEIEDLGSRQLHNLTERLHVYRVAPLDPALPVAVPRRELAKSWSDAVRRRSVLLPAVAGVALMATPFAFFLTAGVLPALGTVLLGHALGRAWAARRGERTLRHLPTSVALALGALWTDWSTATNFLFVMSGMLIAAAALARRGR